MTTIAESINRGLKKLEEFDKPGNGLVSQGVQKIAEGVVTAWKAVNEDLAKKRKLFTSGDVMSDEGLRAASEAAIDWAGSLGFSGQLKGVAPEIARRIRAVMRAQNRLRQRRKATPFSDVQVPEDEIVNAVANSVAFRNFGHDQAGSVGERLAPGKGTRHASAFNVGEPYGVSTTFDPKLAGKWSIGGSGEAPASRVLNLYTARPSDVILQGWKGSKHEPVMQEAYAYALARQDPKKLSQILKRDEKFYPPGTFSSVSKQLQEGKSLGEALKSALPNTKDGIKIDISNLENYLDKDDFGRLMNQYFESKGFEGILYSPNRFKGQGFDDLGEAEIKMFNPKRVVPLEKPRAKNDPAVTRLRDIYPTWKLPRLGSAFGVKDLDVGNPAQKSAFFDKVKEDLDSLTYNIQLHSTDPDGALPAITQLQQKLNVVAEEIAENFEKFGAGFGDPGRTFSHVVNAIELTKRFSRGELSDLHRIPTSQLTNEQKLAYVRDTGSAYWDAHSDADVLQYFARSPAMLGAIRTAAHNNSGSAFATLDALPITLEQLQSGLRRFFPASERKLRNPGIARYAQDLADTPGSLGKIYGGIDSDMLRKALREGARERGKLRSKVSTPNQTSKKLPDSAIAQLVSQVSSAMKNPKLKALIESEGGYTVDDVELFFKDPTGFQDELWEIFNVLPKKVGDINLDLDI